jgi:hypothetical protein
LLRLSGPTNLWGETPQAGRPDEEAFMPYTAEITRDNPGAFVFLIDQSGSMARPLGTQPGRSRADGVADAVNRLLENLVLRCARPDGVRDYFYVSVIGYGGQVQPAFGGVLAGRPLVSLGQVAHHPLRVETRKRMVEDGAGGLVEQSFRFPVWFEPVARGETHMCTALTQAIDLVRTFLEGHPRSYPPVVINITDGETTDGDPVPLAHELRSLCSDDGNALLFNAHLSSRNAASIMYPDTDLFLPDEFAKRLFEMSSVLPEVLRQAAAGHGYTVSSRGRGFAFNADLVSVIRFLNLGTQTRMRT